MTVEFPRRPALATLHTPQLVGCVASGPNWVFSGPSNVRAIALTFDDGPWLLTPEILDVLEREHVPATFFQIGEWISKYGENGALERRMLADGDMIGDHTWTHPDMLTISPAQQRSQIELASKAIQQATGFTPCLWRAPYGIVNPALLTLARSLGFVAMQWDVDPRDWSLPGVAEIYDNILENAHNGAIIEEHDGGGPREETLAALPEVIATLRARGYTFETLTQMLGYKLVYK
jgi:peptidoglycan/xylan/chitin deacetylase (PgdA/CDA1 family)